MNCGAFCSTVGIRTSSIPLRKPKPLTCRFMTDLHLFSGDVAQHAIYVVCVRLLRLVDTYTFRYDKTSVVQKTMEIYRNECEQCCADCIDVFDNRFYRGATPFKDTESTFASGYLMVLVHILRNIFLASSAGRPILDTFFGHAPCLHIKLLYQNLYLSTRQLQVDSLIDAKTICAIATNWMATRALLLASIRSNVSIADFFVRSLRLDP
jgi:hypothetical protein